MDLHYFAYGDSEGHGGPSSPQRAAANDSNINSRPPASGDERAAASGRAGGFAERARTTMDTTPRAAAPQPAPAPPAPRVADAPPPAAGGGGHPGNATAGGGARRPSTRARRAAPPAIPPPSIRVSPGDRGSGYMAAVELRARFPVPPEAVFGLLTHPDKSVAFRNILEVCDRTEVTPQAQPRCEPAAGPGGTDPRVRVFEETQVGETSILWHHSKFRNRLRLEEDSTDPRVMVQRFKLLQGDSLEKFEGSWMVAAEEGPEGAAAAEENEAEAEEPQIVDRGEAGDGGVEDDLVEVAAPISTGDAGGGASGGGGLAAAADVGGEDGWEHVVGQLSPTAASGTGAAAVPAHERAAAVGSDGRGLRPPVPTEVILKTVPQQSPPMAPPAEAAAAAPSTSSATSTSDVWCVVVLKQGLSPKGVPALVRPAVGRMVRSATETSLGRLHQDLSEMVTKLLQGATVDEAMAAVRDEHRAQQVGAHHHHHQHHRQHDSKQQQQQEQQQPQQDKSDPTSRRFHSKGDHDQPTGHAPPQLSHPQKSPAAAAGATGSALAVPSTAAATVAEPAGPAAAAAGAGVTPPLVVNPRTGEVVHRWVA
ncbi:hypothetical protein PLESTB_001092400 [Pleodorina starrii]|uniref:Uncharacterized protein n=1 Tax=Pleodorina starrii TaxID=330485 RepID=A0A9W6F4N3_9CHLO|nr:hypothetical protein PLESTB_001092400 [Pleodorina starrii]